MDNIFVTGSRRLPCLYAVIADDIAVDWFSSAHDDEDGNRTGEACHLPNEN